MAEFLDSDRAALERLNRLRASAPSAELDELEASFDATFGADTRLAVYGSLAPGRSNHDQLASLAGRWISGLYVRGQLQALGRGVHRGFPALRWSESGPRVPAQLFVSAELPEHWVRLDRFEGAGYRRILVPVLDGSDVVVVANLYEGVGGRVFR